MNERLDENRHIIRVVIADDHPVVRNGLRLMLEMQSDMGIVGEAADGKEAVRLVEEKQPDVILMDLRMPGIDGIEAMQQVHQRWPQVAILILTTFNEDELLIQGLQAGARGYLLKDTDLEIILQAIRRAADGEILLSPEVMNRILAYARRGITGKMLPETTVRLPLTDREIEILACVAQGQHSKEIAYHLGVTERTVWAHLTSIYNKLGVSSRAAAVAVGIQRGILEQKK